MPAEIGAGSNPSRVVILGIEHPRGVAAIQSLGRAGLRVVGVDHDPTALGFHSRYLKAKYRVEKDPQETLSFLDELGRDGGGMLMATNDDYLMLVAKNHERLSRSFVLTTPPWETLEPLMDVSRCYRMAQEIGIRTPNFYKAQTEAELRTIVQNLDLERHEFILKTTAGTAPADARTGRYTRVAPEDREGIEKVCLEIFARAGEFPTIMQVVPGTADRCVGVCMAVGPDHESRAVYSVRRLKLHTYSKGGKFVHPYEMGANVFCESRHDEEAIDAATRFVRHAGYYGPMALEFRRDPTDESLVLIKADVRFVRATNLSTAIGRDLPTAVHDAFSGRPAPPPRPYPDGVAWVWLSAYIETLWNKRSDRSLRRELFALWKNLRLIRAAAFLDRRDLRPFLVSLRRCGRDWFRWRVSGLKQRFGAGKPSVGPGEGERAPG